ncbi:hypothetical protein [Pseudoalteromonas aliena]|uniref:hypothetical protein n=1 Tax=Pseudoalteromonas aliena TaxID=247523 RepID=UPI001ABFF223|nr:hypothetical protein [Pseudoalteromonas aliena]
MKKNPRQLTIEQHFHTAHSIAKFYCSDNKVEVKLLAEGNVVKRHKRAKIFCTKRTWDQRAETGYMVGIETAFHDEIDNIKSFENRNHEAISKYCLLWIHRHKYHLTDNSDGKLNGISGSGLTKEQEENLESRGAMFVRDGGIIPSRFEAGLQIQMILDRDWHTCSHFKWGLIEATDGEFLCADSYKDLPLIPISPNLAFWAGEADQKISRDKLAEINKLSIEKSSEFYFARKISDCPVA